MPKPVLDSRGDSMLGGHMVVTRHHDRPGVIGKMGTLLGGAGINIVGMQLGTVDDPDANQAVGILQVGTGPTPEILDEIRKIDAMITVRHIFT